MFGPHAAPRVRAGHSTAPARPARDPSAVCQDGSLSFARDRQGACSWHGGVREWRWRSFRGLTCCKPKRRYRPRAGARDPAAQSASAGAPALSAALSTRSDVLGGLGGLHPWPL
ncbi:MAG TPA: DUF3761 domain-containing protein [Chloroflexota bacterium]|nr:DUF3761 domain-containing protein [Chloroflexota bacterium]